MWLTDDDADDIFGKKLKDWTLYWKRLSKQKAPTKGTRASH